MIAQETLLAHRLLFAPAAYFVLANNLQQTAFSEAAELLSAAADVTNGSVEAHWNALSRRGAGTAPWDVVMPPYDGPRDGDRGNEQSKRLQTVDNILAHRPYMSWHIDGLLFTLDLFNPGHELRLQYRGAGEPVVALAFAPAPGPRSRNPYAQMPGPAFYTVLEELERILEPVRFCVADRLHLVMSAILEGRMHPGRSPWSLLHTATIVPDPGAHKHETLRELCALVRPWPQQRLLLQMTRGFGGGIASGYEIVGEMFGMVPWTRFADGRYRDRGQPDVETADWPPSVRDDGTSPSSIALVSAAQGAIARQALYHMQAAAALQDRGHVIRAVLVPLIGESARITIPVVIERSDGPDACAYTQCEPWTSERLAALKEWLQALRSVSDSEVIIVAREPSAAVAALPDVKEFIHFPYDELPAP